MADHARPSNLSTSSYEGGGAMENRQQITDQMHRPQWATPDSSHPASSTTNTRVKPDRSYVNRQPPSEQRQIPRYDDELVCRFMAWEMMQDFYATLSDARRKGKSIGEDLFAICRYLEDDHASKEKACRDFTNDRLWRPIKLDNFYSFIKEEIRSRHPLQFERIDWDRIDKQFMEEPVKNLLLEELALKGGSLAGCIQILMRFLPRQFVSKQQSAASPSHVHAYPLVSPVQTSLRDPYPTVHSPNAPDHNVSGTSSTLNNQP